MKNILRIAVPMVLLLLVCIMTPGATLADDSVRGKANTKVIGVITHLQGNELIVQDSSGKKSLVELLPETRVAEKKKNFLREGLPFSRQDIQRGLHVEVNGWLGAAGKVVAKRIRFTKHDLQVAQMIEPNLSRVDEDFEQIKADAGRLSGQIDELNGFTRENREQAQRAQSTADQALTEVSTVRGEVEEVAERVDSVQNTLELLNDYEAVDACTVTFKAGSSQLSDEAKVLLNGLVESALRHSAYLVELRGFASADGDPVFNRRLSQRRAESVMDYLTHQHGISPRNFVIPHGYGEMHPVADNASLEGRQQNRRVEATVFVNKGLESVAQFQP